MYRTHQLLTQGVTRVHGTATHRRLQGPAHCLLGRKFLPGPHHCRWRTPRECWWWGEAAPGGGRQELGRRGVKGGGRTSHGGAEKVRAGEKGEEGTMRRAT